MSLSLKRWLFLPAIVLVVSCSGGRALTPSAPGANNLAHPRGMQPAAGAACPVAYKGTGVKTVVKDLSGLPAGDLYLYFTSNVPNQPGKYQFLDAKGTMTPFAKGNAAVAFPIATCFPATVGKGGTSFYRLPLFSGGRLWISFSNKLTIAGASGGGFVGPSGWSPGPGYNQPWDTVELSDNNPGIFVNLTRVDMLGLPLQLEVLPLAKSTPFKQVGEVLDDYPKILQAFVNDPPFRQLVGRVPGFEPLVPRIINPSHTKFPDIYNDKAFYAGGWLNKVLAYYKAPPKPIVYDTSYKGPYCAGSWKASSDGKNFIFKQGGQTNTYPGSLFTSAYIFEDDPSRQYSAGTCPYLLDKILLQELNRGVAMTPAHPEDKPATFYPDKTINNQYACILHKYSLHNATYAFAFDDAAGQASAFSNPAPTQLTLTIGKVPKTLPKPSPQKQICIT